MASNRIRHIVVLARACVQVSPSEAREIHSNLKEDGWEMERSIVKGWFAHKDGAMIEYRERAEMLCYHEAEIEEIEATGDGE